jgi:hypothetical protein
VLVLMNPLRSLGVAQVGCDDFHRLVVLHVRLLRLLNDLQPLKHGRRDLDRVLEPLRNALLLLSYRKRFYALSLAMKEGYAHLSNGRPEGRSY